MYKLHLRGALLTLLKHHPLCKAVAVQRLVSLDDLRLHFRQLMAKHLRLGLLGRSLLWELLNRQVQLILNVPGQLEAIFEVVLRDLRAAIGGERDRNHPIFVCSKPSPRAASPRWERQRSKTPS